MIVAGGLAAILGVTALRYSWARSGRSVAFNTLGWGLIGAAVGIGAMDSGAWGVTVVSLFAMGAALVLLLVAAATSQAKPARASTRRANLLPAGNAPLRLAGRGLTFLLVIGLAMASSIAVAIVLRGLSLLGGMGEANANALAMFAMPVAWTGLMYAVLMDPRRRRQFVILLAAIVAALPFVIPGIAA